VNNETIDLLLNRRSLVASKLIDPGPTEEELNLILRCAIRVPDHGKLAPWRIKVFEGTAREELGRKWGDIFKKNNPDASSAQLAAEYQRPSRAPLLLIITTKFQESRIPKWEQILSGGAVCQNVLVAANALGYHSQWLSEWPNYDNEVKAASGIEESDEFIGLIYIGSAEEKPSDRKRPVFEEIVSFA
tara:strand:- start:785 stop:1348 length:564 start_codon:yes stop_codon:yes gene_type:complete